MIIFHDFEHSFLPTPLIKQNKNNWKRNFIWHYYYFVQFKHKPLLNLPKDLGKMTQTAKNTKKWSCWNRSQSKLKNIGHGTKCSIFIISCNRNISHSFTCPKTWGIGPKWLKILKNNHFSYVWALLPANSDQKAN